MKSARKKVIQALVDLYLLYLNPQLTSAVRLRAERKNKTIQSMPRHILLHGILLPTLFTTLVYSALALPLRMEQAPLVLDIYILFLGILTISQSFFSFYNIFYDSQDIEFLLPLPVSPREIYFSKMITVFLGYVSGLLPTTALCILYFIKIHFSLPLIILMSVLSFLLINGLSLFLTVILIEILTKTSLLFRFKKSVISFLYMIIQIGSVVAFLIANNIATRKFSAQDFNGPTAYGPITGLFSSSSGRLILAVIALATLVISALYFSRLSTSYLNKYMTLKSYQAVKKTRRKTVFLNKRRILSRLNFCTIKDPTILGQLLFSPLFLLIIPLSGLMGLFSHIQKPEAFVYVILLVSFTAYMTLVFNHTGFSYPRYALSLDNTNLEYIRALPITYWEYIKHKIYFAVKLEFLFQALFIIGLSLFLRLSFLWLVLCLLLSLLLNAISCTALVLLDALKPTTGWINTQSLAESEGKFKIFVKQMLILMGGMVLVYAPASVFLMTHQTLISLLILIGFIVLYIATTLFVIYNRKKRLTGGQYEF